MNPSRLLVAALEDILNQGVTLLESIDDQSYTTKIAVAFNGTIGGHYRHCLDHFQSLLGALDQKELDYDRRKRDQRTETDKRFALKITRDFLREVIALKDTEEVMARPILVRCQVCYQVDESPWVQSIIGREVMYSVAHAVHHYALIGIMAGLLKIELPISFGVAPSTIKHRHEVLASAPVTS